MEKITEVCSDITKTPSSFFSVHIHELNEENLALGGKQVSTIKKELAKQKK